MLVVRVTDVDGHRVRIGMDNGVAFRVVDLVMGESVSYVVHVDGEAVLVEAGNAICMGRGRI